MDKPQSKHNAKKKAGNAGSGQDEIQSKEALSAHQSIINIYNSLLTNHGVLPSHIDAQDAVLFFEVLTYTADEKPDKETHPEEKVFIVPDDWAKE